MGVQDEALRLILGLLDSMASQNQALQFRLDAALRQLWSRKSEKVSPDQLALFLAKLPPVESTPAGQAESSAKEAEAPASQESTEQSGSQEPARSRPKKRAFPPDLPRRREEVRVPDEERWCACGREKTFIGHEVQTLWEFVPGSFHLLERCREKLACKKCEEEGVTTAPAPGKPIDGGRPGPGLLAQIVTAKEHDSLPLYRQSQIYERSGIHLAPSTLGDWHAVAADMYEPVYEILKAQTLGRYLLSLDDTPMPVLDREDPRGVCKGRIWTYLGDFDQIGFCEYTKTWEGEAPRELLAQSKAKVVQGDGYAGIDRHFSGPDPPRRAGCNDHCRRKFVKAMQAGDARAALVVEIYRHLYAVEAEAVDKKLDANARLTLRTEKSRPLFERLHRVISELHRVAVPKSPLGKATTYAIRQWPTLGVFLDDGRVPISNAHVERQQRRTALGRKNYLFAGSHDGARRLAILQTVAVNCDILGISMWHYLRDVFARIADRLPRARYGELTPQSWAAAQKAQQADAH